MSLAQNTNPTDTQNTNPTDTQNTNPTDTQNTNPPKSPSSWRNVEIVQQTKFGFLPDVLLDTVSTWGSVKHYAFILHNSDTDADGKPVEEHIHLLLRFYSPIPTANILSRFSAFGIKVNMLQRVNSWGAAVTYLTHENRPEKFQYDRKCIFSNFDVNAVIDDQLEKQSQKDNYAQIRLGTVLKAIESKAMREYNIFDFVTMREYTVYKAAIDKAFDYMTIKLSANPNRNMDVLYFEGDPGTGKTSYAKKFCEDHNLSYCIGSSANDPLQDYRGQDVFILDDFRPNSWSVDDLLRFLDPFTSSSVQARYRNKYTLYLKYVILTSVVPLTDVWTNIRSDTMRESVKQLYRRISMRFFFTQDKIYMVQGSGPKGSAYIRNPVQDFKTRSLNTDLAALLSSASADDVMDDVGPVPF